MAAHLLASACADLRTGPAAALRPATSNATYSLSSKPVNQRRRASFDGVNNSSASGNSSFYKGASRMSLTLPSQAVPEASPSVPAAPSTPICLQSPSASSSSNRSAGPKSAGAKTGRSGTVTSALGGMGGMLGGLFGGGDPAEKTRQQYADRVADVNKLEPVMQKMSDDQLRAMTVDLKKRVAAGESLDSVLPEAFAVVREASKRVLGLRPFDVQLIGGMVLHKGQIAEMRTGEGKTLVAVLPAYLNALTGRGVHVVTVNDYLARRDAEWVGQVHKFLGLSVGLIQQGMDAAQRRESYACDVTYVTNSELGFDFLRDNLATSKDELVLPDFHYCVIDEVDSILIDEARTPLIISGPAEKPSERYYKAAKLANAFVRDVHYTVDEKQKAVLLTEEGYEEAETLLGVRDLYDPREQWASYVINAIKAKELFLRDVQYIVKSGGILIVDEFTGRIMEGRRWSEGLHQAVEAKEGLTIQNETVTLASISYQNFFLQYPKLCGMTGTAATEVAEFTSIYKLTVTEIPTNRPAGRKDESDVVFRAADGKWRAAVVEVARMNKMGRPVLVGTTSVELSEGLSARLREAGVKHQVLNAKPENVEREAEIVAQSGRLGAVTIATNMAGRGTDILLGGNAEFMARLKLREMLMPRVVQASDNEIAFEGKRKIPTKKTWAVNPELYPCQLSDATSALLASAVEAAVASWGVNSLPALEAEDRLAFACEKGPTNDPVIGQLRAAFQAMDDEYRVYTEEEKKKVIAAGGLHVIGTERHESRRIDNQLRGRSGRQGDPGSSRFFLSLEDNIFRIFGGDRIQGLMKAFRVEDMPIESKMLTKALDEAQRKVENYFFDIRKQLFEYDQVLNSQRDRVYAERRRALVAESLEGQMVEYAELTMDDILEANIDASQPKEEWNLEALAAKVKQYCYLLSDLSAESLAPHADSVDNLREYLRKRGREVYFQKKEEVEKIIPGLMKDAERYFVLSQTDNLWKEHLQALKFAQQAVGLRGYAQKDPLIEYKLEGYNLFLSMMAQIRRNVIYSVYQFKPVMAKQPEIANAANGGAAAAAIPAAAEASQATESKAAATASSAAAETGATEAEYEGEGGGAAAAASAGAGPTGGRGGRRGGQKSRQRAGKKVTARSKSS
ncbi:hypothetical protein CLOM_g20273 [Closterium sp. NIES-68]|nr:hypothetical protein CLOM_g20273 [Closterium sp. NIES-68]GJP64363.1 hypothetical protein CLOP_g21367 [Closterium sp. NIES-67]